MSRKPLRDMRSELQEAAGRIEPLATVADQREKTVSFFTSWS